MQNDNVHRLLIVRIIFKCSLLKMESNVNFLRFFSQNSHTSLVSWLWAHDMTQMLSRYSFKYSFIRLFDYSQFAVCSCCCHVSHAIEPCSINLFDLCSRAPPHNNNNNNKCRLSAPGSCHPPPPSLYPLFPL